jgi:hypothetical protein
MFSKKKERHFPHPTPTVTGASIAPPALRPLSPPLMLLVVGSKNLLIDWRCCPTATRL